MGNCNSCEEKTPCTQNKPCGCSHRHGFKCIIWENKDLLEFGIKPSMDGEEVVETLLEFISTLLENQDSSFRGESIGDGEPVYKGFDGFNEQFNSISTTDDLSISTLDGEIVLGISDSFIDSVYDNMDQNNIIKVLELKTTLTPEEYFNSSEIPIEVGDKEILVVGWNGKIKYLFTNGKGVYGAGETQVTEDSFYPIFVKQKAVYNIPTDEENNVELVQVGDNNYGVKTLSSTDSIVVEEENNSVKMSVNLDWLLPLVSSNYSSNSYYVNSDYTGEVEKGTIVEPFKDYNKAWRKVVGEGTLAQPDIEGASIILQTDVYTDKSPFIANTSLVIENDKSLYYTGNSRYCMDTDMWVPDLPLDSNGDLRKSLVFNIKGKGGIVNTTNFGVLKTNAYVSTSGQSTNRFFVSISGRIRFSSSYKLEEYQPLIDNNGNPLMYYDGAIKGQNHIPQTTPIVSLNGRTVFGLGSVRVAKSGELRIYPYSQVALELNNTIFSTDGRVVISPQLRLTNIGARDVTATQKPFYRNKPSTSYIFINNSEVYVRDISTYGYFEEGGVEKFFEVQGSSVLDVRGGRIDTLRLTSFVKYLGGTSYTKFENFSVVDKASQVFSGDGGLQYISLYSCMFPYISRMSSNISNSEVSAQNTVMERTVYSRLGVFNNNQDAINNGLGKNQQYILPDGTVKVVV